MKLKRLGILTCDVIWEPLRSAHGDYLEMYGALLGQAGGYFELRRYAADAGELPGAVDDCDAWVISGSRASAYEPLPWIPPLLELVRQIHQVGSPQVGVCFGHQLMAAALGGKVERASMGWGHGNLEVLVDSTPDGSAPPGRPLRLFMSHQDQVVRLPPGARRLASAAHCPNAMFVLDERVLGIQPHPEFTAAFMRDLTEESTELRPEIRARSLTTMDLPVDNALVGGWMARFLGLLPG